MTTKEKKNFIRQLKDLKAEAENLIAFLEKLPDVSEEALEPVPEETPAKVYTYEEARKILAEKARTGFRAEVKAILTAHGVKKLSDIEDAHVLDAIVAEAEVIGNG